MYNCTVGLTFVGLFVDRVEDERRSAELSPAEEQFSSQSGPLHQFHAPVPRSGEPRVDQTVGQPVHGCLEPLRQGR